MIVGGETKIAEIIRCDERSIEAIARINSHFNKLRNPILRKLLASRVTVKDAANIGKVSVNEFLKTLEDIGFKVIYENANKDTIVFSGNRFFDISMCKKTLDVRPYLDKNIDPFQVILHELIHLENNSVVKVINYFEPTPLINILTKKGFDSFSSVEGEEVWTFFKKKEEIDLTALMNKSDNSNAGQEFERLEKIFTNRIVKIDVRELEMPQPMLQILENLSKLTHGYALFVRHRKVPQFLFPDIEEQGFSYVYKEFDSGEVCLIIYLKSSIANE